MKPNVPRLRVAFLRKQVEMEVRILHAVNMGLCQSSYSEIGILNYSFGL